MHRHIYSSRHGEPLQDTVDLRPYIRHQSEPLGVDPWPMHASFARFVARWCEYLEFSEDVMRRIA
jgi:hypothetical protein